eukprot:3012097-Pyramimonas_sp.AAC.1
MALLDRIGMWSQRWVPSLLASTIGSDFQQWMEWCVPNTADTLRFYGFRDILQCPANTMTDWAKRWELAIELCLHGWYQGAIPRE